MGIGGMGVHSMWSIESSPMVTGGKVECTGTTVGR